MISTRATLAASLLGLALVAAAPGCSTSSGDDTTKKKDIFADHKDPVLTHEAVNADQKFSDDVVVADNDLTIPTTGHEAMLAQIKVGTVIAGNRSSAGIPEDTDNLGPNPYGFLRKVTSIKTVDGKTVITTEKATLDEWLEDGDIDYSSTKSLIDGSVTIAPPETQDGKTVTTKALHILGDDDKEANTSGSGSAAINASLGGAGAGVKISNAQFKMNAKYEGYFKVRYKELRFLPDPPTGVAYKSLLTLDPEVSADIEFTISGSETLAEKEWTTKAVVIPLPGPVPTTLRIEPVIKCSLAAGGSITTAINAKIGAHAVSGFQGDAGFTHFDLDDISKPATPTGGFTLKSVTGKETLTGKCEIFVKPILLAFDAIGIEGKIGPYVSLAGTLCASGGPNGTAGGGFTLSSEYGISGDFGGRIQVPILGIGKDFEGLGIEIPLGEHYFVGDEKTCEPQEIKSVDSCEGKTDGFHCSEVKGTAGGIICKAGSILRGKQCDSGSCKSGTAGGAEDGSQDKITCE